ncbi:HepT-like ribonuclease domain-containing protein [Longibacter sp.]
MRNGIAHDYLNIDLDIVWEVVQNDVPLLKDRLSEEG